MVIIGGGPAGYTAALYAAREGLDTVLIEKMSAGGQMALTGDIDNYPGFEKGVDGFELGKKMQQGAGRFGAKTEYTEVISVDFSENIKKVVTADKTFLGKTVVFAAGDIRTKSLRQIVTAVSDGAVSVHFAEKYLAEKR